MVAFMPTADFDGQLGRSLTAAMRGSADLGEVFAVVERIVAGDVDSWAREWVATAQSVHAEADRARQAGDVVDARRAYLRASEYYRQSFFFARTRLDDPVLTSSYARHVQTFQAAVPLLPYATTPVELDQCGVRVHGYLFRPDDSGRPRPTVLAPAGYDSTAESGFPSTAVSALERGFNCLVFEGPGQGGVLYTDHQVMRPDYEVVVSPVVDWLVTQGGVDPAALVLFGRSFAGYLAPRAAAVDHRFAALVCDPAQFDFGAAIRARMGEDTWRRLEEHDPTLEADLTSMMMRDPIAANGQQWRMTAHGLTALSDYLRELSRYSVADLAGQITCPTLALAGEDDFAGTGQLQIFAEALTAPVTTHTFTKAEGAGGHCEGLGQDRLDQYVYGWLREQLPSDPGVHHGHERTTT
jgi:pimeloyl-ACP methyl ester carboxylesterase